MNMATLWQEFTLSIGAGVINGHTSHTNKYSFREIALNWVAPHLLPTHYFLDVGERPTLDFMWYKVQTCIVTKFCNIIIKFILVCIFFSHIGFFVCQAFLLEFRLLGILSFESG